MSNLGLYQSVVTAMKKCGGPVKFLAYVGIGGYAVIRAGEAGVKKVYRMIKNRKGGIPLKEYVVKKEGVSNEGLKFNVGDCFKVLGTDGDATLIDKIGEEDNPYCVATELLVDISDYRP